MKSSGICATRARNRERDETDILFFAGIGSTEKGFGFGTYTIEFSKAPVFEDFE